MKLRNGKCIGETIAVKTVPIVAAVVDHKDIKKLQKNDDDNIIEDLHCLDTSKKLLGSPPGTAIQQSTTIKKVLQAMEAEKENRKKDNRDKKWMLHLVKELFRYLCEIVRLYGRCDQSRSIMANPKFYATCTQKIPEIMYQMAKKDEGHTPEVYTYFVMDVLPELAAFLELK